MYMHITSLVERVFNNPVPPLLLCVQTLKQLQQRFVGGSSPVPDEETLKWYLRDRCVDLTCSTATPL